MVYYIVAYDGPEGWEYIVHTNKEQAKKTMKDIKEELDEMGILEDTEMMFKTVKKDVLYINPDGVA